MYTALLIHSPYKTTPDADQLQNFKKLSLPISAIDRSVFDLPRFGPVLRDVSKNLYQGTGVNVLRGFPIQKYEKEDQNIVFLGINAWVANERLCQGIGRGICHIKVCPCY
jgi:hypothetical protein